MKKYVLALDQGTDKFTAVFCLTSREISAAWHRKSLNRFILMRDGWSMTLWKSGHHSYLLRQRR